MVATVIWLGWRSALLVLAFPPVALELYHGNVQLLMAAAIALGFRYPVAWSFLLLTKVTPGIGLVWFAVRREWRPLGIALGFTGALVLGSLLVDPQLWVDWLNESILKTAGGAPLGPFSIAIPLAIRLPLAALLVAWAGERAGPGRCRSPRRWRCRSSGRAASPCSRHCGRSPSGVPSWSRGRVRHSGRRRPPERRHPEGTDPRATSARRRSRHRVDPARRRPG